VELASETNDDGAHYFRWLTTYCEEDIMAFGRNNTLSSVYLTYELAK
jgi:hypothetical protein